MTLAERTLAYWDLCHEIDGGGPADREAAIEMLREMAPVEPNRNLKSAMCGKAKLMDVGGFLLIDGGVVR